MPNGNNTRDPRVDEALPYQLRRANQAWSAIWYRHLPDLTSAQFAVLMALGEGDNIDQATLGARAAVDRSTLTPLLDRLKASGLITKRANPANRRCSIIGLTAKGHQELDAARTQGEHILARITDVLGADDLRRLTVLLRMLGDLATDELVPHQ